MPFSTPLLSFLLALAMLVIAVLQFRRRAKPETRVVVLDGDVATVYRVADGRWNHLGTVERHDPANSWQHLVDPSWRADLAVVTAIPSAEERDLVDLPIDYHAHLRHRPSGVEWEHSYNVANDHGDSIEEIDSGQIHLWTDGNFSCDCNRRIFLFSDHGVDPNEHLVTSDCGEEEFELQHLFRGFRLIWTPEASA